VSDGLHRWVADPEDEQGFVLVRWHAEDCGLDHAPLVLPYPILGLLGETAVAAHNREVEWARTTIAAALASRPSMTPAEVEAALTRMAIRVALAVAADLGPRAVLRWFLRRVRVPFRR
jgi:hypothetical protein